MIMIIIIIISIIIIIIFIIIIIRSNAVFWISQKLMFHQISLTNFSEPVLITSNAPTTTGIISVFLCHILVISMVPEKYTFRE